MSRRECFVCGTSRIICGFKVFNADDIFVCIDHHEYAVQEAIYDAFCVFCDVPGCVGLIDLELCVGDETNYICDYHGEMIEEEEELVYCIILR